MPLKSGLAIALIFLALPLFAQQRSAPLGGAIGAQLPNTRPRVTGRRTNATPRQEPCWQEAGISKAAMEQRRSIEQNTRAEIEAVCANSSLTPQQRREQMRDIRERSRQQIDALISPQQREALRACQQSRNKGHIGGGGGFHGGGGHGEGPCGELNEPRNEPREQGTEPER
jgi:hypothetical protein